ncbi:hypothetical protein RhiirA5_418512 [Rhizophagus irregularis]|uniref:Uncharacterized protein n=1 Tax=Rhizophagus irregularis TaxID=588596 RepID=A0A2N0PK95_9GLOM|nr:hypothetical protein RhiirA5_418512 [Rhizophagus irregularis]
MEEIQCQFLRLWDLGLVSVLLALGLGYADVASGSFGNATQLIICKRKSTAVVEAERPIEVKYSLSNSRKEIESWRN